jgi:hypothetical protein
MLFMIIEHFKDQDALPVYRRFAERGRTLPDGLKYIDSWVEPNYARCFQLMETDDLSLLQRWILDWRGTGVTFEIVPVVKSAEARANIEPLLGGKG